MDEPIEGDNFRLIPLAKSTRRHLMARVLPEGAAERTSHDQLWDEEDSPPADFPSEPTGTSLDEPFPI